VEITQRRLFTTYRLELVGDVIEYTLSHPFKRHTRTIKMVDLMNDFELIAKPNPFVMGATRWLILLAGILSTIELVGFSISSTRLLIYTVSAAIMATLSLISISEKVSIKVEKDDAIILLANFPDKEQVSSFMDSLFAHRNNYLRSLYYYVNKHESFQGQLNRLRFLLARDGITKEEYQEKEQELYAVFQPKENRKIGFVLGGLAPT